MNTPADARPHNLIASTWIIVSAKGDPGGANIGLFGSDPAGQLIFTDDLHFAVVINRPDVPHSARGDRDRGTAAENEVAMAGALALYGTSTVDAAGRFASEHIVGSTFRPLIEIIWRRAASAGVGR